MNVFGVDHKEDTDLSVASRGTEGDRGYFLSSD